MERKVGLDEHCRGCDVTDVSLWERFCVCYALRAGSISALTRISRTAASNRAYAHGGIEAIVSSYETILWFPEKVLAKDPELSFSFQPDELPVLLFHALEDAIIQDEV